MRHTVATLALAALALAALAQVDVEGRLSDLGTQRTARSLHVRRKMDTPLPMAEDGRHIRRPTLS